MNTTQIWMICTILVMVFFMILSAVWSKMGKKRSMNSQEKSDSTI